MAERVQDIDFWLTIRKQTRVNGGNGMNRCDLWCEDALKIGEIAENFTHQVADLGEIQIDQLATSVLVHHWLEREGFIADGTAGQFDPEYPEGFYGYLNDASDKLKEVYAKRRK